MKLYYVITARMPSDRAYGIQAAEMIKALRGVGAEVIPLYPMRIPGGLYSYGRFGFVLSALSFMLSSALLLAFRRMSGERFFIYTIDMDTFSYALLPLIAPTFAEMHSPKPPTFPNRFFFAHARGIIATTRATKSALQKTFSIPDKRISVEPNGVSVAQFVGVGKEDSRVKLALPLSEKIAVYVGRFYAWKGLEVLPGAFKKLPDVTGYVVGGEKKEFEELTHNTVPENMRIVGVRPSAEISLWLAAADALIVLGTAKNDDSMRYTSPMKVFEYLAAERPIIASRTEALQEILGEKDAYWYEPDDADSLASAILSAVDGETKLNRAVAYDWRDRATRVVHFIEHA